MAGLVFSRLAERKPDLLPQLAKLRHNLKEEADTASGTNMKVGAKQRVGHKKTDPHLRQRSSHTVTYTHTSEGSGAEADTSCPPCRASDPPPSLPPA